MISLNPNDEFLTEVFFCIFVISSPCFSDYQSNILGRHNNFQGPSDPKLFWVANFDLRNMQIVLVLTSQLHDHVHNFLT